LFFSLTRAQKRMNANKLPIIAVRLPEKFRVNNSPLSNWSLLCVFCGSRGRAKRIIMECVMKQLNFERPKLTPRAHCTYGRRSGCECEHKKSEREKGACLNYCKVPRSSFNYAHCASRYFFLSQRLRSLVVLIEI
jgi:hypothetical protein